MFETLWEAISQVRSIEDIKLFLNDFLSPVERIMLAKRFAIAVFLLKGQGYENIKDLLKVSNATISKVSIILKTNRGYQIAINKVIRTEAGKAFWQDIENLLFRLGRPGIAFAPEEVIKNRLGQKKKTLV